MTEPAPSPVPMPVPTPVPVPVPVDSSVDVSQYPTPMQPTGDAPVTSGPTPAPLPQAPVPSYDSPEAQPGIDAPTTNAAPAESAPVALEVIPFTPTLRRAVQAGYGLDAPLVLHLGSLVAVRRQDDGTFVQPPIEVGVLGVSIPDDYEGRVFEIDPTLATSTVVEPGAHEDATLGK